MLVKSSYCAFPSTSPRPLLHARCQRRSLQIGCQQQPVQVAVPAFHNRRHEIRKLSSLISGEPSQLQVVVGPRNCGKSRLITHYLEGRHNAVYIDCSTTDAMSPTALMYALLKALAMTVRGEEADVVMQKLLWLAPHYGVPISTAIQMTSPGTDKEAMPVDDAVKVLQSVGYEAAPGGSLTPVFQAFEELLVVWRTQIAGGQRPVIIIDEVNVIMGWDEKDPVRAAVLAFLVAMNKQQRHCHVLLLTADYSFQAWLQREIGPLFWDSIVIGDFTEQDAREFLTWELQRQHLDCPVDDKTWSEVYQVCGGNAGSLVSLVQQVRMSSGDWSTALELLCITEMDRTEELAMAGSGMGWTYVQYSAAALELLQNPYHAVPVKDMLILLGKVTVGAPASDADLCSAGRPVLESLVAANALSVRPFSDWALDIPAEAFGSRVKGQVVTAPSAMSLYCMQRMKEELRAGLREGAPWAFLARCLHGGEAGCKRM